MKNATIPEILLKDANTAQNKTETFAEKDKNTFSVIIDS